MVDKCPNCGQPSRPGARFCTSCGFRLPERPVEPEPSSLSRSPFATTSTVAASWWPSSSGTADQPQPAHEDQAVDSIGAVDSAPPAPVEATAEEPALIDAQPEAAHDAAVEDSAPAAEDSEPTSSASDSAPFPQWPSFPSYGSSDDGPASSWGSPASSETDDSAANRSDDLAAAVEEIADRWAGSGEQTDQSQDLAEAPVEIPDADVPSGQVVSPEPDDVEAGPKDIGDSGKPTWSAEPEAVAPFAAASGAPTDGVETAVAGGAIVTGGQLTAGDSLARARSLLDELSSLLPALAAPSAGESAGDLVGIAAALAEARDDAVAQQSQLEALTAVVDTARARPRDIDVMLDLSRQVEAIVALRAGYDRLLAATEDALSQLRAQ
ncbi:MAG: zinc-ribbon domain [Thermomicrobiales bacterium]|nr:zinc-ribbon domain [Thermomicrobiales bacterium]